VADASLLSCVPLFERLDGEERALLAAQLEEETFPAGTNIFRKGEPGNAIYIVASGEVEIFVEDTTGGRIVFETAKSGDFFGELSLLDGDPRSASARAISDARTLKVDRGDLQTLFGRHPAAAMDILAVIGRRLREADKLLGSRQLASPNQAIAERLSMLDRIADVVAAFAGRFSFLLLHVVWFAAWIAVNNDWLKGVQVFDPYPYGLLTMVVSLEAIFLSCLVLISQNRQAAKDRIRSDVEYDANIRAGLEVTQLHVKVDALYEQVLARLAQLEKRVTVAGPGAGAKS
jgi:CRP/FNR family transcriptional regulator, cyclic AMP receptor protein